jgi:radical SAM superfamily enzyme YgiQ (UPF0313 family)
MKIAFIDPPGFSNGLNTGLGYLSAVLDKHGYDVSVLDLNNKTGNQKKRLSHISDSDTIGISIKSFTLKNSLALLKMLKSNATLLAGGPHVTLDPYNLMKETNFDIAVIGEGEQTILKIVSGKYRNKIKSIAFREDNNIIINEKRDWISDIDGLPYPKYDCFDSFNGKIERYPLITSRGCPYNCSYCSVGTVIGKKWRARKPKNIIDELIQAKEKYKSKEFEILDDNFSLDMRRAKSICQLLIDNKINMAWSCTNGVRADKLDSELIELMRYSGCNSIAIGVESGCREVFDKIQKGENLADIENAVSLAKKAGMKVKGFFIIGLPESTYKKDMQSIEYAKKLQMDSISWGMFVPYPGTRAWEWSKKNARFLRDWKDGFHIGFNPKPVFETRNYKEWERKKAYYLANIRFMKKDIPTILKLLFKRILE